MASEALLETGQDRPRRADGELLAGDLKDERPEGIEPRKVVHPGPWTEIRPRIDQPGENRIRLPKKRPRRGIGDRSRGAPSTLDLMRRARCSIHGSCSVRVAGHF